MFLYGATKRCGQLNVKLLFNQVKLGRCSLCCSKSMIYLKTLEFRFVLVSLFLLFLSNMLQLWSFVLFRFVLLSQLFVDIALAWEFRFISFHFVLLSQLFV